MRYEVGKTYIITKDGTNPFSEVIKNNLVGQRFKVHKAFVDKYVVYFLDLPELGVLAEQTFIRNLYTFEAEEVLEHEKVVTALPDHSQRRKVMTKTYHAMSMPEIIAMQDENARLRAALAEREWIDVNEQMPKESMSVLVHCEGGNVATTFYCSDASFFDFSYGHNLSSGKWSKHFALAREYGYKITHWMPLPKPPIY